MESTSLPSASICVHLRLDRNGVKRECGHCLTYRGRFDGPMRRDRSCRRGLDALNLAAEAVERQPTSDDSFGKNSCDLTPQRGQSIVKRTQSMVGVVGSGPVLVVSGQRYSMRP